MLVLLCYHSLHLSLFIFLLSTLHLLTTTKTGMVMGILPARFFLTGRIKIFTTTDKRRFLFLSQGRYKIRAFKNSLGCNTSLCLLHATSDPKVYGSLGQVVFRPSGAGSFFRDFFPCVHSLYFIYLFVLFLENVCVYFIPLISSIYITIYI